MTPWIAIAVVMITLIAVIHGLSKLQQSKILPNPEIIRKLLHVLMGLVTLSFPWVFSEAWPVLTLSIISSIFIAVLKVSNMEQWKPVICASGENNMFGRSARGSLPDLAFLDFGRCETLMVVG